MDSTATPELIPTSVSSSEAPNLDLLVCNGVAAGQKTSVAAPRFSIGAGSECAVRLRGGRFESIYCTVIRGEAGTVIRRRSRNTFLNGEPFELAPLTAGDRLTCGELELEVVAEPQSQEIAPSQVVSDEQAEEIRLQRARAKRILQALRTARNEQQHIVEAATKRETRWLQERAELEKRLNELTHQIESSETEGANLRRQLEEAQQQSAAAEELENLKGAFDQANKAREEAENSLRELHNQIETAQHEEREELDAAWQELRAEQGRVEEERKRLEELTRTEDPSNESQSEVEEREEEWPETDSHESQLQFEGTTQEAASDGLTDANFDATEVVQDGDIEADDHHEYGSAPSERDVIADFAIGREHDSGVSREVAPHEYSRDISQDPIDSVTEESTVHSAESDAESAISKLRDLSIWRDEVEADSPEIPEHEQDVEHDAPIKLEADSTYEDEDEEELADFTNPLSQASADADSVPVSNDEESIEDYMARLMERVRVGGATAATPPPKPAKVEPDVKKAEQAEAKTADTLQEKANAPAKKEFRLEDIKRKTQLPELTTNFEALRDLANQSAHDAIDVATKKVLQKEAAIQGVIAAVCLATSFGLALTADSLWGASFFGSALSFVAGSWFAIQAGFRFILLIRDGSLQDAAADGDLSEPHVEPAQPSPKSTKKAKRQAVDEDDRADKFFADAFEAGLKRPQHETSEEPVPKDSAPKDPKPADAPISEELGGRTADVPVSSPSPQDSGDSAESLEPLEQSIQNETLQSGRTQGGTHDQDANASEPDDISDSDSEAPGDSKDTEARSLESFFTNLSEGDRQSLADQIKQLGG